MRVKVDSGHVREVFESVSSSEAFTESRALMDKGEMPVEMLQAMSLRPTLLDAMAALGDAVYPGGVLERNLKEKVILKASELNNCQFCSYSHRAIMKRLGISQDAIDHVDSKEHLTAREQLALVYTVEVMNHSERLSDALFGELRECFDDAEIVELTMLVGYINMLNMFNNALGIEYRGEYG